MERQETFYPFNMTVDGVKVYGDFIIKDTNTNEALVAGYFDRAKARVKAVACSFGKKSIGSGYTYVKTDKMDYKTVYKPVKMGRDRFVYAMTFSKSIGATYILTTEEFAKADFFQFCMKATKLPLMEDWKDYLFDKAKCENILLEIFSHKKLYQTDPSRTIPIHGKATLLKEIMVFNTELVNNESIGAIVSNGLKKGEIKIIKRIEPSPLVFTDFDSYIENYGSTMVKNLENTINPLSPLKGNVNEVAFKHKRLFPQQAACVNGIVALRKSGSRYGLMIEGMGCGKTLQGAGVCDAYYNSEWLRRNPGKTLKDLYLNDTVKYRNIMMAPSHLVEKWKSEILSELPNTSVTIIDDLSKLEEIRARGKNRNGREWFLISKDTCKLSYQYSPIPTDTGSKHVSIMYCKDCAEVKKFIPKRGIGKNSVCPECGGKHFMKVKLKHVAKQSGMLCPKCGELLLEYSSKLGKAGTDYSEYVLKPKDFATRTQSNSTCYHCGYPLWGADARPVDCGGEWSKHVIDRKNAWYKISHFKNKAKKGKKTAFVLRGHEKSYLEAEGIPYHIDENGELVGEFEVSKREYGPRKVAPADFIKKQLKGYFDFCILDEAHKYESGGTAQTNAAHALVEASDFTLALTGTICNGKADSFFYLLYMLDPRKMNKLGFRYEDVTDFARKYGTVESVYEVEDKGGTYNSCSRGRIIQSPRVKPGISPLLFVDLLLDKAVFLDLSDLSKYIPKLTEEVCLVPASSDVALQYAGTLAELKGWLREGEGRSVLSNILQFGLSYLDKPFGRENIKSTKKDDRIIGHVQNFDEYAEATNLLPKEEKLVELVNKEIGEGRNCFVYACYTGDEQTNVTGRLKEVIEANCNLRGRVQILNSNSPEPTKREAWIKQKASEGMKVFICNPKCVETGLDFCFDLNGKFYNYPTLIFYQMSYELSVIWQASRRHYRLNQTESCRTYYLAYENTMQAAAIEIMAEKQVAASAIQGKFSAEGLAAMAEGVDPRIKLAQKMAAGDNSDRKTLENMFDAINSSNNAEVDESAYGEVDKALTYYELMGILETKDTVSNEVSDGFDLFSYLNDSSKTEDDSVTHVTESQEEQITEAVPTTRAEVNVVYEEKSIFDMLFDLSKVKVVNLGDDNISEKKPGKSRKSKNSVEGQINFFDFLSA